IERKLDHTAPPWHGLSPIPGVERNVRALGLSDQFRAIANVFPAARAAGFLFCPGIESGMTRQADPAAPDRATLLKGARRVVVKVGTGVLCDKMPSLTSSASGL